MSYCPIKKLIVAVLVRFVIIFLTGHWPAFWAPLSQLTTTHPVSVQSALTSSYPRAPVSQVHYSRQVLPQNFIRICRSSHGFCAFRKSLPLLFDHKNYLLKTENYDSSPYVIDASLQLRPVSCLTYWIPKLRLFYRVPNEMLRLWLHGFWALSIICYFKITDRFRNMIFLLPYVKGWARSFFARARACARACAGPALRNHILLIQET